jgi:hypothetical protein
MKVMLVVAVRFQAKWSAQFSGLNVSRLGSSRRISQEVSSPGYRTIYTHFIQGEALARAHVCLLIVRKNNLEVGGVIEFTCWQVGAWKKFPLHFSLVKLYLFFSV